MIRIRKTSALDLKEPCQLLKMMLTCSRLCQMRSNKLKFHNKICLEECLLGNSRIKLNRLTNKIFPVLVTWVWAGSLCPELACNHRKDYFRTTQWVDNSNLASLSYITSICTILITLMDLLSNNNYHKVLVSLIISHSKMQAAR